MPATKRLDLLGMRVNAELSRLHDVERLLPCAVAADDERAVGLQSRIDARIAAVESAADRDDEDWSQTSVRTADNELVVDEVTALLLTRLLRDRGLELSTFDAAESFLAELVTLAGVPELDLGQTQRRESLDHNRGTVALRFPGSRVWDLPILAHEASHHIVAHLSHIEPALKEQRPLENELDAVSKLLGPPATIATAHGHELIADAVATVIMAETYPVACTCLRIPFLPLASKATETHPAWTDRIGVIRRVLDALSEQTGRYRYRSKREEVVDKLLADLLGDVPASTQVHQEIAERVVRAIHRHRPGLIYADADLDIQVADRLDRDDNTMPEGVTVRAIVAGSWRWRLAHRDRSRDEGIADRVVTYVRNATQLGGP
jgi:hypothetical protein